jgi:hypothetical protein
MKRLLVLAVFAACLVSTRGSAQRPGELQEGVRVRVTRIHGGNLTGTYLGAGIDSVRILEEGHQRLQRLPASDVSRIEVSRGRSRAKGALIKGLIGLGVGAASGAILGAATYSDDNSTVCTPNLGCGPAWCIFVCSKSQAAGVVGTLGGAVGLLIGIITGAITGQEQWQAATFRQNPVDAASTSN